MASVLWSETPDQDREGEQPDPAEIDDTFAERRLRRWIKGMFGGKPKEDDRGNQEAPPTEDD